ALEEERWELLPGEAYTKGFLRTYAEFLGLDGNLYIDEYNARIAADEEPLVPQTLAPAYRPRRGVIRAMLGIFVVTAGFAAFAAWGFGGSTQKVAKSGAAALRLQDAAAATEAPFKARALPHAQPLAVSPSAPLA